MNPFSESSSHMHGGNIEAAAKHYGIPLIRPVTDFSVNINPLGPPDSIRLQWPAWLDAISSYPSADGAGIAKYYHKRFHLPAGSVLPGNGSIELIYLVPRALNIQKAVIFTPSFHDYGRACRAAGVAVTQWPLTNNDPADYLFNDKLVDKISKSDAVFFGNPNNPTGSLIDCETVIRLAKEFPGTWFLVDEAFSQFLEHPETYSLIGRHEIFENIIVFHSLTKFYALPGLRMGAAISHPKTIARLSRFKEPWTVNAVAEKAAEALIACQTYEIKTRRLITEQRKLLLDALNKIPAISAFKTPANFIFARLNAPFDPDSLISGLLRNGLYIRDCRNFTGLDGNFFRIAVRNQQDNLRLIRALTDICRGKND